MDIENPSGGEETPNYHAGQMMEVMLLLVVLSPPYISFLSELHGAQQHPLTSTPTPPPPSSLAHTTQPAPLTTTLVIPEYLE